MTQLPEGRAPIDREDLAKLAGHPSTYEAEIEILKDQLARAEARRPVVKPLVWVECADGTFHDNQCMYEIEKDGKHYRCIKGVTGGTSYLFHTYTVSEAKSACQADYARFILDAIEWEESE